MEAGTRRERGWRLTKASWRLARRDPTLVPLALLAIGCTTIACVAMVGVLSDLDGNPARTVLVAFAGAFVSVFVLAFLCTAIAHAASAGFEGEPLTMREAIGEARLSLGTIAVWSLISVAVTIGVGLLRATGTGGDLLGGLIGLLWGFFVAYAIPIIALSGAGAGDAIEESAALARRRWGEQLSGGVAILALSMLAATAWGLITGLGVRAVDSDQDALGAVLVVVGVLGLAFTAVLSFTTTQTFVVALYRFDGGELSLPELESPPPAPPIGRSPVLRIAGIVVGLLVAASLVGALLPHDRDSAQHDLGIYTEENGYFYTYFDQETAVPLEPGSPVVYEERAVGGVVEVRPYGERIVVWFRTQPDLAEPIHDHEISIGRREGVYHLQIGPPGSAGEAEANTT